MSHEQLYYDTLKAIARNYQTPAQLRRGAHGIGLTPEEHIEYAYENIQTLAANAIRNKRRPK